MKTKCMLILLVLATIVSMLIACQKDLPDSTLPKNPAVNENVLVSDDAICDHRWIALEAVVPTCTETGLSEGKVCAECGEVLMPQEVIQAKGHTEKILDAKEPTCTETGMSEGKICTECNEILTEQSVVEVKPHVYQNNICVDCKQTKASKGLVYSDKGTYYEVSGIGNCKDIVIVIPEQYNGKPVRGIGDNAFYNAYVENDVLESIKCVILPEGVTVIGENAFAYCTSLEEVRLPKTLTHISAKAFGGCYSLKKAELPKGIVEIGASAFAHCSKLENMIIPFSVSKIDMYAFIGIDSPVFCCVSARPDGWHISWKDYLTTAYWLDDWELIDGVPAVK